MSTHYQSIPHTNRIPIKDTVKRIFKDRELQVNRVPEYGKAIENPDGSWSASPAEVNRLRNYK